MPYELKNDEPLPIGIRRIAGEMVDSMIEIVRRDDDPEVEIHELRKACKEMRGLLRLVRDEIGDANYKRENAFYRNLARPYSERRDRWVFVETIDKVLLPEDAPDDDPLAVLLVIARGNLLADHEKRYVGKRPDGFDELPVKLSEAKNRIADWPIDGNDFDTIRKSLKRVYKRGSKGMAAAAAEPDPEKRHEWRKRVKYLWHQIGFLRPIWPGVMEAFANEQHELSSLLGQDHDLDELRNALVAEPGLAGGDDALHAIEGVIAGKQKELQAQAFALGERLYQEEPNFFADRLGGYWSAARE